MVEVRNFDKHQRSKYPRIVTTSKDGKVRNFNNEDDYLNSEFRKIAKRNAKRLKKAQVTDVNNI